MPVRRFWVPQNTVWACALCGILLHHILPALQNLRFRLFGLQKRRQPKNVNQGISRSPHDSQAITPIDRLVFPRRCRQSAPVHSWRGRRSSHR